MRKYYTSLIGAVLLFASVAVGESASAAEHLDKATMERLKGNPSFLSIPAVSRSNANIFGGQLRDFGNGTREVAEDGNTIGPASVWGTLKGPDGNEWLCFQENTIREGTFSDIETSEITIYDFTSAEVGKFTISIPEDWKVNDVQVFGQITSNFFNNDSKYEVTVYLNRIIDYVITGQIAVYSLDGTQVATYDGESAQYFSQTANFSTYQRYMIVDSETVDGVETVNVNIYAPASYANEYTPTVEHTFAIPAENLYYSDGPYANVYFIDGEPYFVISQYEKPYMQYGDNYEMEMTPDNNYLVKVYDGEYQEVASLSVPVTNSGGDALYTMYTFGYFSYDDLCRGTYSDDERFNFIITRYDYIVSNDSFVYNFDVYDEDGERIAVIGEGVTLWKQLSDIDGQPVQVALMRGSNGNDEAIQMVNLPSCEVVTTFPGVLDGNLLSTSFDRYPVRNTYQYVFGLGDGIYGEDGGIVTRIGWYNIDTSLDHFVNINLGTNGLFASHQFVSGSLNPYLFNTDDLHEYIFIANTQLDDGSTESSLCIANDNGEIIRRFGSDPVKGAYNFGYLSNANASGNVHLFVVRVNDNFEYTVDVYALPFTKFEGGGSGTLEDPYIINTPGDLDQVRNTPNAHYALGKDVDMSSFYGDFSPIEEFRGSLDGRGYSIDNLSINGSEMYSGLFYEIYDTDVTIKDLTFNNAVLNLTADCMNAGIVAGYVASGGTGSKVTNVHVNNATISADGEFAGYVGGIAGSLVVFSSISGCSVNGILIDAPSAVGVGGLVGETRTSASITASRASGTINADSEIGGILGSGGTGSSVSDCYADMQLTGRNTIGGIVGSTNRSSENEDSPTGYVSAVSNCYATGSIAATEGDWYGNYNVGGIAGMIDSKWTGTDVCDYSIQNCFAALESIETPAAEGDEPIATVGRIIGFTIADEEYMEGEEHRTESGLVNNHALSSMELNGSTVASSNAASVDGADVAPDAADTDFFTNTLGFAYGTSAAEPWKEVAGSLPILFFEERATGITVTASGSMLPGSWIEIVATVEGTTADRVVFTSSDMDVAEVISVAIDGNKATATVYCYGEGSVEITAEIDGLSDTYAFEVSGVNNVAAGGDEIDIYCYDGNIVAKSALHIEVYSMSGVMVANADGELIEAGIVGKGIYIVVATDAAGNRQAEKVIVK